MQEGMQNGWKSGNLGSLPESRLAGWNDLGLPDLCVLVCKTRRLCYLSDFQIWSLMARKAMIVRDRVPDANFGYTLMSTNL
jgi:hypothetical protein